MSILWVTVLVLSGPPLHYEGTSSTPSASPPLVSSEQEPLVPPRTGKELGDAVHNALKQWARPTDKQANSAAREFLTLYKELQTDTRLAKAQREELRTKVRGRLIQLARQIAKRETREGKGGPATVKVPGNERVLAQMGGFAPGMGFGGAGAGMGLGGRTAQADDDGQVLIDLIQQVVTPAIWDSNGGPASISYWRNQRALIVSAPGEAQEDVGYLLEQLRRASN
jgi:hypothetical protein